MIDIIGNTHNDGFNTRYEASAWVEDAAGTGHASRRLIVSGITKYTLQSVLEEFIRGSVEMPIGGKLKIEVVRLPDHETAA